MRTNVVHVYATAASAHEIRQRISQASRSGWEECIQVRSPDPSTGSTQHPHNSTASTIEQQISRDWQHGDVARVFVEKTLRVKCQKLELEGVKVRSCSIATMCNELLDEVKKRRFHWLTHSEHEWRKAGIQHLHPNEWRHQFSQLGYDWVGEGLLKQLRVISDAELREGIQVSDGELLGLSVGHGCVCDEEPGSSSINVRDLLEHTYTSEILDIDFKQQPQEVSALDRLYVYEDGLWSGVELVKRLALLAQWPAVQNRDLQVSFRFAATSDAGLYAARHFLRRERLTSVDVSLGGVSHSRLLKTGALEAMGADRDATDEAIRRSLDSHVDPIAFRPDSHWQGRSSEALEMCRSVGQQLVRPWLMRTKGADKIDERAHKWALGAFGFSSLTSFSKSVPKPALPLLWLSGTVELAGKTVDWQPLFWDSRRTGASPPTRSQRRA
jgi:hypothetical protein